ncbi:hypothetical protein O53_2169, partial [Microcystis aeruginosa 11-30S32]
SNGAAEILLIPSTADVMAFCQRGSPGIYSVSQSHEVHQNLNS